MIYQHPVWHSRCQKWLKSDFQRFESDAGYFAGWLLCNIDHNDTFWTGLELCHILPHHICTSTDERFKAWEQLRWEHSSSCLCKGQNRNEIFSPGACLHILLFSLAVPSTPALWYKSTYPLTYILFSRQGFWLDLWVITETLPIIKHQSSRNSMQNFLRVR